MTKRSYLLTYNAFSRSARDFSKGIGARRLRHENSNYSPRDSDVVFNWGCCEPYVDLPPTVYNNPDKVQIVTNKLSFFKNSDSNRFKVVPWTEDRGLAQSYPTCISRTLLRANSGRGIQITTQGQEPPLAPLYTRYIKKKAEFRVHVAFGEVIDVQRKIRDPEKEVIDWKIRNHSNGFIFARESGEPTEQSLSYSLAAIEHYGLDYGAVDIIETNTVGSKILEINTAPGITNTTLERYVEAFRRKL